MSDVLPDNCKWEAMHEPVHCCGATSRSGFPTIQPSSCAQHPSNVLKLPGTIVCLPSDHVVQIHDGQCVSNQKTQPTTPWSLNDSSMLFLVEETLSLVLPVCLVKQLKCLCKIITKFAAKFHTRCFSSSFSVTLSQIWRTACARAQFSRCSSTTSAHSETGQMAVCCQNLRLGALSVLVGTLFKKFGLFLNTAHTYIVDKLYTVPAWGGPSGTTMCKMRTVYN